MSSNFPRVAAAGVLLCVLCACTPGASRPSRTATAAIEVPTIRHPDGETPDWWFRAGAAAAHANLPQRAHAKNVIVFLGDGMSIPTIAAARILDGQRKGGSGEENRLAFENFPATALSRTYETDRQTPDSAGTMTAIMSGVKTRYGVIGVDARARRGDCASSKGTEVVSALELAAAAGLATGIVTTTRITHATPAATYGHLPERNWEADANLSEQARADGCIDFARQLAQFRIGGGITVALGGGRSGFMPKTQADPEYANLHGKRTDGRDLIAQWNEQPGAAYVWNARQLDAIDATATQHLLGLFEPEHLKFESERAQDAAGEPSLSQMTRAALRMLAHRPNGYFLMVEGGNIDRGHHAGNAFRALDETTEFSRAVQVASELTSADDTLIIVTADHSHTLALVGYPARGNPILGKVRGSSGLDGATPDYARDATGLPFTTLSYANGPGYLGASDLQPEGVKRYPHDPKKIQPATRGRPDLSDVDTEAADYQQEALVPLRGETHGGEDVAVFARGPGSAAVHGSMEQNALFHVIAQNSDAIRAELCAIGACNANGIPVERPSRERLLQRVGWARRVGFSPPAL